MYQIIKGDSRVEIKSLASNSLDCIVTDPSYSSLEKHRKIGTTTRLKKSASSSNEWFNVVSNEDLKQQLIEMYRVLKDDTHAYILCDQETMMYLYNANIELGLEISRPQGLFKWWKGIVWNKQIISTGYHYRCQHEMIVFLEKGHRNLNDLSIPDVLSVRSLRGYRKVTIGDVEYKYELYPTEKPTELLEILISNSTKPGELIADFYCGSGAVLEASNNLGRHCIGFDESTKAIDVTNERMNLYGYKSGELFVKNMELF